MDVVRRVRNRAGGTKTGHAGTLDPLATGALICCLGRATRSVETIMGMTKVYEATINLTGRTESADLETEVESVPVTDPPSPDAIDAALADFEGEIEQLPPKFSALRVGGRRAYELARKGKKVPIQPRIVRIDGIERIDGGFPELTVRITCGRGTYIRSIARDLGLALETGGYLTDLRRLSVGPYLAEDGLDIAALDRDITADDLRLAPER